MRERKFGRRVGVTSVVAIGAIAAFALIGGTGLAKELANPGKSQYGAGGQYHGKVTICHKGHVTISVAMVAWFRAHQHHGDTMGPCSAAAVQAAKRKAAKVKAAKLKAKHGQTSTGTGAAATTAPTTTHGSKGKAKGHASSASAETGSSQTTPGSSGHGNGNGHGKNG